MPATLDTLRADDGATIAYRLDGAPEAPPLVLLNSLGTSLALWDGLVAPLSARHRLIRLDFRGHGGSTLGPGALTVARLGQDVLQLLDRLGLARADLCGVSLGGMVAAWLAANAPARVRRLVIANSAAVIPAAWDQRIATVRQQGLAAIADAVVERWFTPAFQAQAPDAVARIRTQILALDPEGYAAGCGAVRDADLTGQLGAIQAPTLVIAGSADPATPLAWSETLVAAIDGARLAPLAAAHLSCIEQPAAFADAVLAHLEG